MKKVVVLSLLFVCMRGNAEAAVEPSPLAAVGNDNSIASSVSTALSTSTETSQSSDDVSKPSVQSNSAAKAEVLNNRDAVPGKSGATIAADAKEQWSETLKTRNPFIPFGTAPAKAPEKEKKADDWASKKADELNLYSVTKYPTYTEVSIEVIETKKRCWVRSDKPSDKVPFVFVDYDEEKKVLTVKNTVTGGIMSIRQQEKKKETSRGSRSSYDYDDYGSSYYDDFLFSDFD